MYRRIISLLSILLLFIMLTACSRGNVGDVDVIEWEPSNIYTDEDIEDAIETVKIIFQKTFLVVSSQKSHMKEINKLKSVYTGLKGIMGMTQMI